MLAHLLLLACPALMPTAAPAVVPSDPVASDPQSAELVGATYDLSVLNGPDRERHLHLPLLPGLGYERHDESGDHETVLGEVVEWMLVDVLHAEELQYAGREIGRWDDSSLRITAPQAVHDDARRLIDYLAQASGRRAVLRFDQFAVTNPAGVAVDDDLDGLITRGLLIPVGSRRETVSLGVTERRGGLRNVQFVRGWESEIATSSTTLDPMLESWDVGTQMLLHLSPSSDGRFALSIMEARDELLDMAPRMVALPVASVSETGPRPLMSDVRFDLPRVDACRLTAAGVLGPGDALLIGAVTETLEGLRGGLTRVVLESVSPEPEPLRLAQGTLQVLDVSRALWSGLHVADVSSEMFLGDGPDQGGPEGYTQMDMPEVSFPSESMDWDRSVYPSLMAFQDQGGGLWSEGGLAVLWSDSVAVDAAVRSLARTLAPARSGVLTWGLEDGAGRQVAAGRLPMEASSDAFALVGEARAIMQGTHVDVATQAFSHHARSIIVLDGLGLRARLRGDLAQVHLARSALAGLEREDLGRDLVDVFDRVPADRIDLQVSFPADGSRHDLGRVDAGGEPLTLWARLAMAPDGR